MLIFDLLGSVFIQRFLLTKKAYFHPFCDFDLLLHLWVHFLLVHLRYLVELTVLRVISFCCVQRFEAPKCILTFSKITLMFMKIFCHFFSLAKIRPNYYNLETFFRSDTTFVSFLKNPQYLPAPYSNCHPFQVH